MTARLNPDDLAAHGTTTVIIAGIDMQGRLFGKRVPVHRFAAALDEGLHVCTCVYSWDLPQTIGLEVEFAGAHTGWHDFVLRPDVTTLRRAGWLDATAICLADSVDENTGEPLPIAPRTILGRAVDSLASDGYVPHAATELEFFLYRGTPAELRGAGYRDLAPTTLAHSDYNIFEGDLMEPFFAKLREILEISGVRVEVSQVEYGHGQWEINLEYATAVAMADQHALFKHIVRAVAAQHGYTATFMPRPLTDDLGSSCHIHVSLLGTDGSIPFHDSVAPRGVADRLLHAVGGVLAHTPDLFAYYAPTVNAYRRTTSQDFAGNDLTWGFDNRTTSVRVLTGSAHATRLEFRLPGADVNPYLALAGLLWSMSDGIASKRDAGPADEGDAYATAGAVSPLPTTLGEAAERLLASDFAATTLGGDVVRHYHAVARHEWQQFQHTVTDWERERYFESI